MNRTFITKIAVGALLIISMAAFLMPIAKFGNISISMMDMMNMSSDVTDLMDEFGEVAEMIGNEVNSYFVFCLVLFVLPVLECILLFTIKNKMGFIASIAGILLNNAMAYIFYDKISETISLIKEAISFLSMVMEIETAGGTVIFWCILYALILVLSLFGLLEGEFSRKPPMDYMPIRDILAEEIPSASSRPRPSASASAIHHKPHPAASTATNGSFKPEGSEDQALQQTVIQPMDRQSAAGQPFFGGIIGESGIYKGKARMLKKGETLVAGMKRDACDIWVNVEGKKSDCCELSYDAVLKEYHVKPLCQVAVFLESGQPLGKDRLYCLPRGMGILIGDQSNRFTLA